MTKAEMINKMVEARGAHDEITEWFIGMCNDESNDEFALAIALASALLAP